MKRITVAVCTLVAMGVGSQAFAQTFACQELTAAGLLKEKGRWHAREFNIGQPFFLKVAGRALAVDSVANALGLPNAFGITCSTLEIVAPYNLVHSCSGYASYLTFSPSTRNGAYANTFGALQPTSDQDTDTVAVTRFTCQEM